MGPALNEIIDRVRAAAASGAPLAIRGGGSKDFYGATTGGVPVGDPLSMLPLSGIVSYEPTELVVTVRAGTPLAELEAALAEKGQCLPFEPPHFGAVGHEPTRAESSGERGVDSGSAAGNAATRVEPLNERVMDGGSAAGSVSTVGGMLAAGLSGPARASVGAVRDYVLGAQLLNGRAELLTFGGQVMKNVAGYDVSRVLVGSLGVLGVIVEVSLKVLPKAPAEATLKFELSQGDALSRLNEWGGQPLPLNASCWVEDRGVGTLFLRLRGAVAAVEAACERLGGERIDNAQAQKDWADCREQRLPWFAERGADQDLWRLSVPQTAGVLDLPEAPLIEWHGGQRWVRAAPGAESAQRLRNVAADAGGHATLFVAAQDQHTSAFPRFEPQKPPLDRIQRQLKREFDPQGIFNRGRLSPDY